VTHGVDRRSILNGTLFSGLAALTGEQQSRNSSQDNRDDAEIARAISDLTTTVQHAIQVSPELAGIRDQQRTFLKANQKFPDFIEVGVPSGRTSSTGTFVISSRYRRREMLKAVRHRRSGSRR
jgi:hypothetical protein